MWNVKSTVFSVQLVFYVTCSIHDIFSAPFLVCEMQHPWYSKQWPFYVKCNILIIFNATALCEMQQPWYFQCHFTLFSVQHSFYVKTNIHSIFSAAFLPCEMQFSRYFLLIFPFVWNITFRIASVQYLYHVYSPAPGSW